MSRNGCAKLRLLLRTERPNAEKHCNCKGLASGSKAQRPVKTPLTCCVSWFHDSTQSAVGFKPRHIRCNSHTLPTRMQFKGMPVLKYGLQFAAQVGVFPTQEFQLGQRLKLILGGGHTARGLSKLMGGMTVPSPQCFRPLPLAERKRWDRNSNYTFQLTIAMEIMMLRMLF